MGITVHSITRIQSSFMFLWQIYFLSFVLTIVFILLQWSVWACGNMTGWLLGQNVMLVKKIEGWWVLVTVYLFCSKKWCHAHDCCKTIHHVWETQRYLLLCPETTRVPCFFLLPCLHDPDIAAASSLAHSDSNTHKDGLCYSVAKQPVWQQYPWQW